MIFFEDYLIVLFFNFSIFQFYYISYIDKDKRPEWNVNSVNPLYLLINIVYATVSEENGVKYLKINEGDTMLFNKIYF